MSTEMRLKERNRIRSDKALSIRQIREVFKYKATSTKHSMSRHKHPAGHDRGQESGRELLGRYAPAVRGGGSGEDKR
jgi:hypothetical protein